MRIIHFRLTGATVAVERILKTLESMDNIDRIEEVADPGGHPRGDSSSRGDGAGADVYDIELHARSAAAASVARDHLVLAARAAGVAVEFVENF